MTALLVTRDSESDPSNLASGPPALESLPLGPGSLAKLKQSESTIDVEGLEGQAGTLQAEFPSPSVALQPFRGFENLEGAGGAALVASALGVASSLDLDQD